MTDNEFEPEDMLFSPDQPPVKSSANSDDGWEPISESWAPPGAVGDLESLLQEQPGFGEPTRHATPKVEESPRRNLLPPLEGGPGGLPRSPDRGSEAGGVPLPGQSSSPSDPAAVFPNSRLHQSHGDKRHPSSPREALPTAADAPRTMPVFQDSKPTAWIIPVLTAVAGTGAGGFMCMDPSTVILGGIVIAVSLVGGLLLRVLLRH